MSTLILSNGSKWADEEPDSVETLLEVLKSTPLARSQSPFIDPTPVWTHQGFHAVDGYCYVASASQPEPGQVHFSGNFWSLSHVFSIYTDDPAIIARLTETIKENMQRPDYLSQTQPADSDPYYILFSDGTKVQR